MKYIITESQYNLVLESQKHEQLFQDLIDSNLKIIRYECDKDNEYSVRDVSDFTCDQVDQVERIEVMGTDWSTIKNSNHKYMIVKLMVYYSSIYKDNFDADDLIYDLKQMIRKSTGMPLILDYKSTNTNTQFDW